MTRPKMNSERASHRLAEISALADEVAEEICPGTGRVDPFEIAAHLSIPVLAGNYRNAFDGLLEFRGGEFYIYYDAERLGGPDNSRVRFTVAHELGHWYIDEHRECLKQGVKPHGSWTGFVSDNAVEREADCFAAHLLMPRSRFSPKACAIGPNLKEIFELAQEFDVSRTSCVVRYVNSNVYACAVVLVSPENRISWICTSKILADRVYPTVRPGVLDNATGTLGRIARANADPDFGIHDGPVDASTWFRYADGSRDEELFEEVVSLGRFGTLIFLSTEE